MMVRVRRIMMRWIAPVFGALALVGSVAGSTPLFDLVENEYQDGFKGATGYLPRFHPTRLSPAETTLARVGIYATKPDPSNISLEFPDDYAANIVCYGGGFNAGPHPEFGDLGANISGMTWHDDKLYVNDFSGGPEGAGSGPGFAGGRLHQVDPVTGARVALIANLPAEADHQNNAIVFFKEKGKEEKGKKKEEKVKEWLVFEQGTTTNSGTVDGEGLGDIPCYDIQLTDRSEEHTSELQ